MGAHPSSVIGSGNEAIDRSVIRTRGRGNISGEHPKPTICATP